MAIPADLPDQAQERREIAGKADGLESIQIRTPMQGRWKNPATGG